MVLKKIETNVLLPGPTVIHSAHSLRLNPWRELNETAGVGWLTFFFRRECKQTDPPRVGHAPAWTGDCLVGDEEEGRGGGEERRDRGGEEETEKEMERGGEGDWGREP